MTLHMSTRHPAPVSLSWAAGPGDAAIQSLVLRATVPALRESQWLSRQLAPLLEEMATSELHKHPSRLLCGEMKIQSSWLDLCHSGEAGGIHFPPNDLLWLLNIQ